MESCFLLESLGASELRGISQRVETFKVVGPAHGGEPRPQAPLVGRDFELSVLERTFEALVDGRGAVVAVMGEPGIGKTRLISELRAAYSDRVQFVEGRSVSYAQSFAYWPIRDLLREWLGAGAATPEARVRLELKAQLAHVFGSDADEAYPFVASVLGITLEPDALQRLRELNRESIQTRTFDLVAELVCRLSRETPLCLVLDDLHWADESTLDLLEHLFSVTDDAAVALLLLYRTEREHRSWRLGEFARQRYPHRYREIELRPLPADASRSLATAAAGAELPDSVSELLAERAGGNPFFLEEALRDLVERGVLERDNGRWSLAIAEDELVVPALVQGALQARLDRLDPATREVLSVAAVVGRTFGLPLLEEVLPRDQVQAALAELQRLELAVEVRRRPVAEYRFRHGLVQEVAYASLVETRRRRLHLQVGDALERLVGDAPEQAYALLGRHFAEADEPGRAAAYLLKAGDAARAVYAEQEAVAHYERARMFLARTGDDARARETLFKIALARHNAFDFAGAEEAYDEAFCCGLEAPARLEPTEQILTNVGRLGPVLVPGYVYSSESVAVVGHLFRGLLAVDRDLNVVPSLADNFRVSADGLTYLFRIRDGARWSDGEPVTAEDFAWTWKQMANERATTAFMLAGVEARAIDDRTLEVQLDRPRSYFPFVLASVWTFPWPKHACERLGPGWKSAGSLVSSGPFMLAERDDEQLLLRANPHWAGACGNIREIRATMIDPEAAAREWRRGRYDVLGTVWPIAADEPDTIGETFSNLALTFLGYRVDRAPFDNQLVRRAVAHALDRERLAAGLSTVGLPAIRGGAIPPAMPGHSQRIALAYDPELARKLLAEAGYPGGKRLPELRMAVHRSSSPEPFCELLGEFGVRVRPEIAGSASTRRSCRSSTRAPTCSGGRGSREPGRTRFGASCSTPRSSVAVPEPDEPQAFERQPGVDLVDRARMRCDQLGQPPGRDHARRRRAELGADPVDDRVDLAGEAVDEPRLERVRGVLGDHGGRLDVVDLEEAGGAREQRIHRDLDPRREHAADVLARSRDHVEVRRRAEVDDDARHPVPLLRGDRVRDPVGPDLARVVVADRDAGADARTHRQQLDAHPFGQLVVGLEQARNRRREHDAVEWGIAEKAVEEDPELVAGAMRLGRDPPVLAERLVGEEPEDGLGVPDVDREQHARAKTRRRPGATRRSAWRAPRR